MKVCTQTLILVDNNVTITELNQKIVESTLKYMIYHMPENRTCSLSTYSHVVDMDENYMMDTNDLLYTLDSIEFNNTDSNLTDVLSKVITSWRDADFACRNILVFTNGIEGTSIDYEDEELYYLIENTDYPIYIVDLLQDNNATCRKHLSALATTSGGRLFTSEFPGDDGGVDRQLTEMIFEQMDAYSAANWEMYEEGNGPGAALSTENIENQRENAGEAITAGETLTDADTLYNGQLENENDALTVSEETMQEYTSEGGEVIYSSTQSRSKISEPVMAALYGAMVLLAVILMVVGTLFVIRRKKRDALEEKKINDRVRKNTTDSMDVSINPRIEDFIDESVYGSVSELHETAPLVEAGPEDAGNYATRILTGNDNATRLLSHENTHDLELSDIENVTNTRVLPLRDSLVIGRGLQVSDIVIENDDSVSKRHCEVGYSDGEYYIADLSSANGTFVNGVRISKSRITTGDHVKIGQSIYRVRIL